MTYSYERITHQQLERLMARGRSERSAMLHCMIRAVMNKVGGLFGRRPQPVDCFGVKVA